MARPRKVKVGSELVQNGGIPGASFSPFQLTQRTPEYEKAAFMIAKQLAKPSKTSDLDTREMLTKTPKGLVVELSLLNAIGDITEADNQLMDLYEKGKLTYEEMENLGAVVFFRSIQKHVYQNFMSSEGWRADQVLRMGEAVINTEHLRNQNESIWDRLKHKLGM